MVKRTRAGCITELEEARRDWVNIFGVEFVELALFIDEDVALQGLFRERVVPDDVVGKVVDDFQREEIAWRREIGVPGEDGAVDDLDVGGMASRGGRTVELRGLARGERGGDFDHFILGPVVDVGVRITDIVKDIEHQGAIARANLVDDQILIWGLGDLVAFHEVAGDCFAIVWTEEFGRGIPQLTSVVGRLRVESVLKIGISLTEKVLKVIFIGHACEIKGFVRCKDDGLFGEVAIVGIVETVYHWTQHLCSSTSRSHSDIPSMNSRVSILTLFGRSL